MAWKMNKVAIAFVAIFLMAITATSNAGTSVVSTYMTTGGSTCSTTPSSLASISLAGGSTWGMATDSSGNIYVVDRYHYVICKISTDGTVVRIAGTGTSGIGSDNIQATSSALSDPFGIAVDNSGNIYFTDDTAHSVRKINSAGIVSTIFNTSHTSAIGTSGGLATSTTAQQPVAIVIDPQGRVVFTDYSGCTLWRIENNGYATKLAGRLTCGNAGIPGAASSAGIGTVGGIAFDSSGNIFLTEWSNYILKLDTSGNLSVVAGTGSSSTTGDGGAPSSATVSNPWAIIVDSANNIYWGERGTFVIRQISGATGLISTVAGIPGTNGSLDGNLATATLGTIYSFTTNTSGDLFFGDGSNKIRKISAFLTVSQSAPPVLQIPSGLIFRTASSITLTTTSSGVATFFQNGKAIPGCKKIIISGSSGGTATCVYKPSIHGTVVITSSFTSNSASISSTPGYAVAISPRSMTR